MHAKSLFILLISTFAYPQIIVPTTEVPITIDDVSQKPCSDFSFFSEQALTDQAVIQLPQEGQFSFAAADLKHDYSPPYDVFSRTAHLLTNLLHIDPDWFVGEFVSGEVVSNNCITSAKGSLPLLNVLAWNPGLQDAATFHCNCMASSNGACFSHDTCPAFCQKFNSCAFSTRTWFFYKRVEAIGENLAKGFGRPIDVMAGWINSPTHCGVLTSNLFKEMGIHFINDYVCQSFGGGFPNQVTAPAIVIGSHVSYKPDKFSFFAVVWGTPKPARCWVQIKQQAFGLDIVRDNSGNLLTAYSVVLDSNNPILADGVNYLFRCDGNGLNLRFPDGSQRLGF